MEGKRTCCHTKIPKGDVPINVGVMFDNYSVVRYDHIGPHNACEEQIRGILQIHEQNHSLYRRYMFMRELMEGMKKGNLQCRLPFSSFGVVPSFSVSDVYAEWDR